LGDIVFNLRAILTSLSLPYNNTKAFDASLLGNSNNQTSPTSRKGRLQSQNLPNRASTKPLQGKVTQKNE